jgi:hypothetical protein
MAVVAGVFLLALIVETFHFPHYSAPALAALGLMIAVWAEHAWSYRVRGLPAGKALVLIALASPAIVALSAVSNAQKGNAAVHPYGPGGGPAHWPEHRVALIERLSALNGRQLVIVRYPSPGWNIHEEWVYNGADIDQQQVVFAHDLGTEDNRALLNYYPDRTAWLLTFDTASEQDLIEPYASAPSRQ